MHLILLSGGSGKRLWPLSNDVRSKQFLKVLPRDKTKNDNGSSNESMVQRVYRQINEIGGWDSITIAAGASQSDQLGLQLDKGVNIVIEPERRDTFPAIALACSYLYDICKVSKEETIAVLPVDAFVENDYFSKVAQIESELNESNANLVLLGAIPLFPSEKYGYIVPKAGDKSEADKTVLTVASFKEKPNVEGANDLINMGALWNCGVFGLKLRYVFDILADKYGINDFSFKSMTNSFKKLKKTSFDYEVVEKAENIRVIPYNGEWKDLGTWETLTEEMATAITGNVIIGGDCSNTHVVNERELPIAVIGIKDAVVVASNDGILVANKGETYKVKDLMSEIKIRPMYEEKRWGKYKVIEHTVYNNGDEALTKKLFLNKGQQISYQYHNHRKEIWSIIRGEGILYYNGEKRVVKAGDVVNLKEKEKHGIMAVDDLEIIEVQLGSPLVEDDIIRLEYDWI